MPLYLLYIRKLLKEAILTVLMTDLLDSMVQNRPSILFCFCKLKQSEICPSSIHYFVYECPGSAKTNNVKWDHDLKPHTSTLPESWRPDIRGQGSRGWAPCRGSRGGSAPLLPASGGSGRPSLGCGRLPPVSASLPSPPPSPRGFSAASVSLFFSVL